MESTSGGRSRANLRGEARAGALRRAALNKQASPSGSVKRRGERSASLTGVARIESKPERFNVLASVIPYESAGEKVSPITPPHHGSATGGARFGRARGSKWFGQSPRERGPSGARWPMKRTRSASSQPLTRSSSARRREVHEGRGFAAGRDLVSVAHPTSTAQSTQRTR